MKTNYIKRLFFILIGILYMNSCDTTNDVIDPTDCNNVENGTSLLDSCGVCQQAYIYDFVTHDVQFIDDTINLSVLPTEMIVLPNNPMSPYWNSSCNHIIATVNELDASNYQVNPNTGTLTGDFVKFNFTTQEIVTGDSWDVAFRGTSIIVNGGESSAIDQPERTGNAAAYIVDGVFNDISQVDTNLFLQDNLNGTAIIDDFGFSGLGWCTYNMSTHTISPIPGKVLIFRTHDNKYVKVEILNFYDTPMTSQYGGFYTFNYVLINGSTSF